MRLLLKRSYRLSGTRGGLFLGNRRLCFVREAPKSCFSPERPCVDEGVYELEPAHTETEGWIIRVGDRGWIRSRLPEHCPEPGELIPVTAYRADGTPLFTRLAFLKLLDELSPVWERGEVIELEVVSQGVPYRLESCRTVSCS